MRRHSATDATEPNDEGATSADPFGVELPTGWTRTLTAESAVYEAPSEGVRVELRELSHSLALYWWVDVYERVDGEWRLREAGDEDTFDDPQAAAEAAQSVVDGAADGAAPTVTSLSTDDD
jgi:hypothetical protein